MTRTRPTCDVIGQEGDDQPRCLASSSTCSASGQLPTRQGRETTTFDVISMWVGLDLSTFFGRLMRAAPLRLLGRQRVEITEEHVRWMN